MAKTMEVTSETFEAEVVQAELPVLVDFWADWCQPCKMIAPIVEELAQEYDGRVKFAKLDVDESPQIAGQFGIRGIPTLLVFHGGAAVETVVGAVPKSILKKRLDSVLAKG